MSTGWLGVSFKYITVVLICIVFSSVWIAQVYAQTTTDEEIPTAMNAVCMVRVPERFEDDMYRITWDADFDTPAEPLDYTWQGTDGLSDDRALAQHMYTMRGLKEAFVTGRGGGQERTLRCTANVVGRIPDPNNEIDVSGEDPSNEGLGGSCEPEMSGDLDEDGILVRWDATRLQHDEEGVTYLWSIDGYSTTSPRFEQRYFTPGLRHARVVISRGSEILALSCEALIERGARSGGCFIATAAFGTSFEPHVETLRTFRDTRLEKAPLGNRLVHFYYNYSPPIARFIKNKALFRFGVRAILRPIVFGIDQFEKYTSLYSRSIHGFGTIVGEVRTEIFPDSQK